MAKKKKAPDAEKENAERWLLTYADMITLLMVFFIVLYAMAVVNKSKFEILAQSLGAAFAGTPGASSSVGGGTRTSQLVIKAVSSFKPEVTSNKVRISSDERGVVITLASDAFFKPASADVDIEATRDILVKLADLLKSSDMVGRTFRIEGHTDASPVDPNGQWPSNWELSSMRAINTLHYLSAFGVDEKKFQVTGLADTQPISSNETEEGRAYNRRIDVIILDPAHL